MPTEVLDESLIEAVTMPTDALSRPEQRANWSCVFGLQLAPYTFERTVEEIECLIASRRGAYVITANLHWANLAAADKRLQVVNDEATILVADGMPLVWASWFTRHPLPERVAGSDLTPVLCERAAARGYRIYLFGGQPHVADRAADILTRRYPGLEVVGTYSPSPAELESGGDDETVARILRAEPDLLFIALGQPKGERWMQRNHRALGRVVSVQVGATIDFIAGNVARAPRWMQRSGLEWVYRMIKEPLRLGPRYAQDLWFLIRCAIGWR